MKRSVVINVIGSIFLIGCTSPFFPLGAMSGVDTHFGFAQWRLTPQPIEPVKVQFGGRIVYATSQGNFLMLVVSQLPLVEEPVYRLQDVEQPNGEFVILYPRPVDKKFLEPGNHVLAVGVTSSPIQVLVEKTPIRLPTMTASCLHFWSRTQQKILLSGSPGVEEEQVNELTYCMAP